MLEEIVVVTTGLILCISAVCVTYFQTEQRKAQINQNGISARAAAKMGADGLNPITGAYSKDQWWVPIVLELVKSPEIMKLVAQYAPGIISKLTPAQVQTLTTTMLEQQKGVVK